MSSKLLTASEAADLLNVTEWRVYQLARQNRIPTVRLGRLVRFSPIAVDRWIDAGGSPLASSRKSAMDAED